MKKVLLPVEAAGLAKHVGYDGKLRAVSKAKGQSDDTDSSFMGKNLLNVLAALGKTKSKFAKHLIFNKAKHPDGPGAKAFYDLFVEMEGPSAVRPFLIRNVRRRWPSDVTVNGRSLSSLHLGLFPSEVDDETAQFWSCAVERVLNYVLTGVIPAHLRRTAAVQASRAQKAKAILKRPASKQPGSQPKKRK